MSRILNLIITVILTVCINNSVKASSSKLRFPSPNKVLSIIKLVNDNWQDKNTYAVNSFWHRATYQIGNLAAYDVTKDARYKEYSTKWSEYNNWKGAKSDDKSNWKYTYGESDEYVLFGDWQACFHVYADLYLLDPDPNKIARAKDVFGYEMSTSKSDYIWWTDGLFMVMPTMIKLFKITQDDLYIDKMYEYFEFAKDLMYDSDSKLFYRDAKYIYPKHKTINGKKDFWARGNGWAFAALAQVLENLPKNSRYFSEYLEVYQSMASSIKKTQQPEGFWARSMLDLNHASGFETSGTSFFMYGLLWGVNNGYLSPKEYKGTILRGWGYLNKIALQPDGIVGFVQPIGERADQNKDIGPRSTADFGVGAFLLASSEMYRFVMK